MFDLLNQKSLCLQYENNVETKKDPDSLTVKTIVLMQGAREFERKNYADMTNMMQLLLYLTIMYYKRTTFSVNLWRND